MDAIGPVFQGQAQAQQYTTQAALAAQQSKDVSLQATETSEQRREQLRSSLSNISANRAQGGLSNDSPTAIAIQNSIKATAQRTEQIGRTGSLNQEQSLNWQSAAYKKGAKNAIIGGYINGFTAVAQDAAKAAGA